MKYRKLRIAWSVGCAAFCLLLMVLWVRSYWWADAVYIANLHNVVLMRGKLCIDAGVAAPASLVPTSRVYGPHVSRLTWKIGGGITLSMPRAVVPIWEILLAIAACAPAAWLRWRFSLRALLIGMTLVAAILGAVVWAVRN